MKTLLTLWHLLGLAWDQFVRWWLPAESKQQRYLRWKNNWSREEAYGQNKQAPLLEKTKPTSRAGACVRCGLCESIVEAIPPREWTPPDTALPVDFLQERQGEHLKPFLQREDELVSCCPVGAFGKKG